MTTFLFCHGIANGPAQRAEMHEKITGYLQVSGLLPRFTSVHVAQWRSLGDFMADLYDLKVHPVRWREAVQDVSSAMCASLALDPRMLVVAHSLGQPLAVSALDEMSHGEKMHAWERASLLSLGGPMGNPFARPYFLNMPQNLWAERVPGLTAFEDLQNPEDPVCGGPGYEKFLAAQSHRVDIPGHPAPWNPLAEHSAYWSSPYTYAMITALADQLDAA